VSTTVSLRNFSFMTRPSVFVAVNPHLNCSLRTWTSNEAQAGIYDQQSRNISRHGEFEDRRDVQLRRSARLPARKADATWRGRVAYESKSRQAQPEQTFALNFQRATSGKILSKRDFARGGDAPADGPFPFQGDWHAGAWRVGARLPPARKITCRRFPVSKAHC
jgi:hypothetical protein